MNISLDKLKVYSSLDGILLKKSSSHILGFGHYNARYFKFV